MNNFIRTGKTGYILGLLLLALAGFSAGCSTKAETVRRTTPEAPPREVAATTQTPSNRMMQDPYADRQFDGDFEYPTPTAPKTSANLNKASFDKIKTGMTLDAVEKLMGEKGMLVSTMDVNGRKTQTYKWSNDNFSTYIDVVIENGKVAEKKDKGLK